MGLRGVVGALLLIFALGGNALAGAGPDNSYYSFSITSCADFVDMYSAEATARKAYHGPVRNGLFNTDFIAVRNYVAGWLTAYNMAASDTYNVVPNIEGAMLWLNNYCTKNPLKFLDSGLQAMVTEAYPSRQQKPPGQ